MAILQVVDGYQPVCGECGLALCFALTPQAYERTKGFWDVWRCQGCDPHVIGSFARWLESHNEVLDEKDLIELK